MKSWHTYVIVGVALVSVLTVPFFALRSADASNGWQNLLKEKRTIATQLCVAMVRSGAYTQLDDNALSDYCIKVASHLGDSNYDHTD